MTELAEKIHEWQWLCEKQENADDHTICPKCREQLYFCDCLERMAREILTELLEQPQPLVWTNGKTFRKYTGQDKKRYTIHTSPEKGFAKCRAILIPEGETN